GHRPQRERDTGGDGSRLHHQRRAHFSRGEPGSAGARPRSAAGVPWGNLYTSRVILKKIMKPLCLLFLFAAAAFSQPFSYGVKGGMPMTDFVDAVQSARTPNIS